MFRKIKRTFLWQATISPMLLFLRNIRCKRKKKIVYRHILSQNFKSLQNYEAGYIVSLTSHGDRLENTLPYALYSLFIQEEMPDRIVLYLDRDKWNYENLPSIIQKFIEHGLEVRFIQDIGPHTKLIPALIEYPNSTITTADDDIYYPPYWFKKLKSVNRNDSSKICCYTALEVNLNKSYNEWAFATGIGKPAKFFPLGVHGVLYPKKSLLPLVTSAEFLKITPKADDIWFWAMAALQNTEVFAIQDKFSKMSKKCLVDIVEERHTGLNIHNVFNNQNEIQINAIFDRFPKIKEML